MMGNLKKVLTVLAAAVLAAGVSSCNSVQNETVGVTAVEKTETVTESIGAEKNLYGGDERITFTIGIPKKENVIDYENNYLTKWIENKCNVDLDFVFFSSKQDEYLKELSTMLAANEKLPDILWGIVIPDDILAEYDNEGYFVDMNQWLLDEEFMDGYDNYTIFTDPDYCPASDWELYKKKYINAADGKRYHIGEFATGSPDDMYSKMYINQEWIKTLGLSMPDNYDDFVEVLKAFRDKDPNGNGISDEIPLVGAIKTCEETTAWDDPIRWLINNWVYYNENYLFNATDGQLWLPSECNEYRKALKNIKELVDENLLSTKVYTIKETSELKALYFPPDEVQRVGVFCGHIILVCVPEHPGLYQYTWLTPFVNAPANQAFVGAEAAISSTCEYPERAMKLLLATSSQEGNCVQRYGEKGVDWTETADPVDGHIRLQVVNNDAFAGLTDKTWALNSTAKYNSNDPWRVSTIEMKDPVTDMEWSDYKSFLTRYPLMDYLDQGAKCNPEEIVGWFSYTEDEQAELGTVKTDYVTFIRQARAEFITGVRDINSDDDWNEYLLQCRQIGSEKLLSISQKAYTRSMK